ncbi:DUF4411 family protein [Flavobacterium sp.]|uniref:DUF4411 family protein n=1 Tax=Flavobacterium sp. TaxID=239 RepID=UPI0035B13ECA
MIAPFLLDSNFFIEAYRTSYPFDVVPSFWMKVKELAEQRKIISIDKVKKELLQNKDELSDWIIDNLPEDFFKDTSSEMTNYATLIGWVYSKSDQYSPTAISEFLDADEADAWLIAFAMTYGNQIVTHEVSKPNSKSRVMLPDAANPFNIICIKTIDLFRALGVKI